MVSGIDSGVTRLEKALAFLRDGDFLDWHEAYVAAGKMARKTGSADWEAIRDMIVIASHGAPHELSYLGEEFKELIARGRKS